MSPDRHLTDTEKKRIQDSFLENIGFVKTIDSVLWESKDFDTVAYKAYGEWRIGSIEYLYAPDHPYCEDGEFMCQIIDYWEEGFYTHYNELEAIVNLSIHEEKEEQGTTKKTSRSSSEDGRESASEH